jgi:hypothetical protein
MDYKYFTEKERQYLHAIKRMSKGEFTDAEFAHEFELDFFYNQFKNKFPEMYSKYNDEINKIEEEGKCDEFRFKRRVIKMNEHINALDVGIDLNAYFDVSGEILFSFRNDMPQFLNIVGFKIYSEIIDKEEANVLLNELYDIFSLEDYQIIGYNNAIKREIKNNNYFSSLLKK